LSANRPTLRYLQLPTSGVTKNWVQHAAVELRLAIVAAASTMTTISASWSTASTAS